ncbi:MAG: MATE family efflux transporter [Firmicutes bacterium]|nr:MATE family efflux transporter [Bacillota bacterium]
MRLLTRDKSFYTRLVALAIPVALQNLITFLVNFADNIMVSTLGDSAVSGVYMGNQLQTLLQLFSGGVEGAILILASQYWGKKNLLSIKRIIATGFRFTLCVSVLLTAFCLVLPEHILSLFTKEAAVIQYGAEYLQIVCLSYVFFCITQAFIAAMRSVESANIGMIVSAISLVSNISLNYVFIFGKLGMPALGIKGVAIATVLSRIIEMLVMVFYVFFIDRRLCIKPRDFLMRDRAISHDYFKYGLPLMAGQIVWSVNMMAGSAILGRFADDVIAAVSIANTMNSLAYVTMNGMSGAVGIITGKTVGAGETELMKEYARTVQVLFLCFGFITGGTIFLLKNPFISLYSGISAGAAEYSSQFINVISVTLIGSFYQGAGMFGLVKSGGDTRFVFLNDTIFVFLIVLPSALITLNLGAEPWIVFACLKCDQILKCFVAVVKINSFNWMKNLTRSNETA